MIVVLDCNIWISLAITRKLHLIASLSQSEVKIASCPNLTSEVIDVLHRPKLKRYFTREYQNQFLDFYRLVTNTYIVSEITPVVSDSKDDYLFALCKISAADYFVTGDKLLLQIEKYFETTVVSLSGFENMVKDIT